MSEIVDLTTNDLLQVITAHARADDRSLQIEIGPSEIGNNCERRVMMALLGSRRPNVSRDEWTAAVGTACHTWVEGAFHADNARRLADGLAARWLIETQITIREGLFGHCDLFDLQTMTVIDHKFPGVTAIRKYKRNRHPGQQYEWQAHLYGLGWARLGFPVRKVALIMYPRSGLLRDAWLWREDYNEDVALEALARVDKLLAEANISEHLGMLETYMDQLDRDTEHCSWCPYFDRTASDPVEGCKGPFYDPTFSEDTPRHEQLIPGIM